MARIRELIAALKAEGLPPEIVTGGGTGTFDTDVTGGVFTEIQPGSYPFMDREYYEIARVRRAAVRSGAVRAGDGHRLASGPRRSSMPATRHSPPKAACRSFSAPSLPTPASSSRATSTATSNTIRTGGALRLGDPVDFQPPHCDPTINLYNRYHCVRGDTLVEIWPVDARGY